MYQPNLPNTSSNQKRQEKIVAWVLTILLHLLLIGGGLFWYFQQPKTAMVNDEPITTPLPATVESIPAPTVLQAEIDTTATPPSTTVTPTNTPTTIAQANTELSSQIAHSTSSVPSSNIPKSPISQKPDNIKNTPQANINPTIPPHSEMDKNDFPVNGSTTTHTDTKTIPTAYGSITTTTTNRITTVAPEIDQALTDRDIPAKERRISNQQTSQHLSDTAKKANQLSKEIDIDNDANSKLIDTIKRKNQASIDNDHAPAENK